MTSSDARDWLLVGGCTAPAPPTDSRDPFEALDDLLSVIDQLCPVWPPRDTFAMSGPFVL